MTPIVITKVAKKYAYAVNQDFINSEDEKETTFKILLENDTAYHCARPKRVFDSIEQFDSLTKMVTERMDNIRIIKTFNYDELSNEQIKSIVEIINKK